MLKAETRPLLVKAVEQAKDMEAKAYQSLQAVQGSPNPDLWAPLAVWKEAWDRARVERAQAELQLWLADREWERQEAEQAWVPELASQTSSS